MATPRLLMPMRPIPITATEMRSFAPFTAPVKSEVVSAAPAPMRKSLRSVIFLSFGHDVDQLIGNHDDFHNLLALQDLLNFIIGEGALLGQLPGGSEGNINSAPELAVDLHGHFRLFFAGQLGIEGRPGLAEHGSLATQLFPQFL